MVDTVIADQLTRHTSIEGAQRVGQSLALHGGRILPETFGQVIEFSRLMAEAGVAVPKHLRGFPGVCMSVIQRSLAWEMDPWAVATKTYAVNDILAYEAQLIAAVVMKWAPLKEKVIAPIYEGAAGARTCSFHLHHKETGEEINYTSPKVGEIKVKNSPLWTSDVDQQLFYYSIRAMARRFFPGLLMGVYDREEALAMKDITPKEPVNNLLDDGDDGRVHEGEVMTPDTNFRVPVDEEQEPYDPETGEIEDERMAPDATDSENYADLSTEQGGLDLGAVPVDVDFAYARMVKSVAGCIDMKALNAWKVQNNTPENKALLGPDRWKALRKVVTDRSFDLGDL